MARIRTIKPEFFTSADIAMLTPLSRLFYIALWCEADKLGRLSWNTKTLKFRYLPADDCNVDQIAKELVEAGLIIPYEVDGAQYVEIPSFTKHQVINNRESDSVLPPRVKVACPRVKAEGRKEGREGKEDASKQTREISLPEDFKLSDDLKAWAIENGFDRLEARLDHFRDWAIAGGKKYRDWDATFRNAVRGNWAGLPPMPKTAGAQMFAGMI